MTISIDQLYFSRRQTIALQITRDGKLVVRAPNRTSQKIIYQFITSKQHWITKKIQQALERQSKATPKNYLPGEKFLYLGESYPLAIVDQQTAPVVFDNYFLVAKQHAPQTKEGGGTPPSSIADKEIQPLSVDREPLPATIVLVT